MTTLRLERVGQPGSVDRVLARLRRCTLWRTAAGLHLDVDTEDVDPVVRGLAFAGVRAERSARVVHVPEGLVGARGRLLDAVRAPLMLDVVRIERLRLASECIRLIRGPVPLWPVPEARRARCRALLRGDDAAFGWMRIAWASPAVLRDTAVRRSLHAAMFASPSLDEPFVPHRAYASDARIERWAFS